jgi:hypothetical protein
VHEGWARGATLLAKSSFPIGPAFTATVEALRGDTTGRPIDATLSGPMPSGLGPGNWTAGMSSVNRIELEGDSNQWHLRGDAGIYATRDLIDDTNRVVGLERIPLTAASTFRLATADASAVDSLAEGKTLNFGLSASRSRSVLHTAVGGAESAFSDDGSSATSDVRASASYVLKRGKANVTTVTLRGESRGAGASGMYLDASGTYGDSAKHVFGRLGYGTRPVPPGAPIALTDPAAAQYDCAGSRIVVNGPNEAALPVAESHLSVGASADLRRGSLSAQIYRTTDANLSLSNALGLLPQYAGQLPPTYEAQLLRGYEGYGGCSGAASPGIFIQHDVSGLGVEYRGLDVLGAWKPNQRLTAQVAFHAHEALLRRAPPELQGAGTAYVVGRQLPAIPLFDASLTVDWALGDNRTELIGNAAYTPVNNSNRLPAYSLVTFGASRRLSATTSVTIVGTNVTHQFVGLFASTEHAVALPAAGGLPLLLPATPLVQPQVFLIVETRLSRQH